MRILLICLCMVMGSHAAMAKSSIYRMMIGGRILELGGAKQLTDPANGEVSSASISPDGKYVVYLRKHLGDNQACLIKLTGGRTVIVMSPPPNQDEEGFIGEVWTPHGSWAWSPDSKLFALWASHTVKSTGKASWEYRIAVFNTTGTCQVSFPVKGMNQPTLSLSWSPDSRKLAGVFFIGPGTGARRDLLVFDIASGSMQPLVSEPEGNLDLVSWNAAATSLSYAIPYRKAQLREVNLVTKEDKVIKEGYYPPRMPSPDAAFELDQGPVVNIRSTEAGEGIKPIRIGPGEALGWAPNSKMLVYQKPVAIKDESGKREQDFNMLWLAAAEVNPFNHMCAAFDAKKDQPPTWSKDCLKMAYVSDGKVYVAEFAWKPITPYDKLDAGLPLTETDEQEVLMDRAVAIGKGIGMYFSDWDGAYPSGAGFAEELTPYTRDKTVFFRPGTEKVAFQYFHPSGPINFPATTVFGFFDVGYGWKVVLYADGHVQVVPK